MSWPPWQPLRSIPIGVPLVRPVVPPLTRAPRACPRTDMHGAYYAVIASRERDAHRTKEDSECTQISWSRCCHVAAGCALSMQGTSAGNRIKETTRSSTTTPQSHTPYRFFHASACRFLYAIPAVPLGDLSEDARKAIGFVV
jgi:hypothetical protein